jgi:DNA repair exonuclease SbcCD ATPase subunit
MIIFKTLKYKNFLSSGNNFTEIDFTKNKTTLVVGHNGSGKSTMLDALSYALFSKAHRPITKDQLVNSINKKDCIVEVGFAIGQKDYRVVRGVRPNVFEIWRDGELINQESHSREYQKVLEQTILKLNHKTFHQIIVLGSTSFIPFMQLTAVNRRGVIEDLLDIHIFSKMNILIKEKLSSLKERAKENKHQLEILKTKIESQTRYLKNITQINEDAKTAKLQDVGEYKSQVSLLLKENETLTKRLKEEQEPIQLLQSKALDEKSKIVKLIAGYKSELAQLVRHSKFYKEHDTCPTCDQTISSEKKDVTLTETKSRGMELTKDIENAKVLITQFEDEYNKASTQLSVLSLVEKEVHGNTKTTESLEKTIQKIVKEIEAPSNTIADINNANTDLDNLKSDGIELNTARLTVKDDIEYCGVIVEMLKDTGIKTKIIKQYLPVMNKLINQYLQVLDFYVSFNIDENFVEKIRSRHRDDFCYQSFSEGEKQRIDLALMFTWRTIAKMKNSISTNLLILDETFDSSLDHDGIENLLKILNTLDEDTNVFVISHKGELLDGKFNNKIEFYKDKNFSKCMESS